MPSVIVRHFETLFFVMMNRTEKCPTFCAIFHLHFRVFKKYLKATTVNFCKTNTLMVCINKLFCASILLSSDKMDRHFTICT